MLVCSGVLKRGNNVKRGRCRPTLACDESVRRDLKECGTSNEVATDRSIWRLEINMPKP